MRRMIQCSSLWTLMVVSLVAGCAGQRRLTATGEPTYLADATTADAVQAAEDILGRMHFDIEKADSVQGVVRTRPLRGAQVFEFWRQDNSTASDVLEVDLHTLRKSVELQFKQAGGQLSIDCRVRVERLSIPEAQTASVSHAYQMHSRSTPTTQTLELSPRQKQQMAWIDLGEDPILAQRIVEQIVGRIEKSNPEGAQ